MASALVKPRMTPQEFLEWEKGQVERHDFVNGETYNMSGGTQAHSEGALSTMMTLRTHLKGGLCRVFNSDVQVRVESLGSYFYPDLSVTCSAKDLADPKSTFITEPTLIVEVLSPSTAEYDRGDKFQSLRSLPSLKEYALLDVSQARLEVFRRNANNRWELYESIGPGSAAEFESVGWTGTVAQLLG